MRFGIAAMLAALIAAAPVAAFETTATHALIIDMTTGAVLFEKNADKPMPPSSMSKMMTVYMLFRQIKDGKVKLDDKFPVSERAWRMGGSKMFVELGNQIKVEDLIKGIVVQSGNDASIVVAEALGGTEDAFAAEMTKFGKTIGLRNTVFKNATGWPDPDHLTSAHDLAVMAQRTVLDFPDLYKYYRELNFTYHGIKQGNRNPLLYKNIGADGLKTGHTEAAGYGVTASVERNGRRLIVVLNGMSSMKVRSDETERLIEWGFREFDNYQLFKPAETVEQAEIWLGESKTVPLALEDPNGLLVTLPRKSRSEMKVAVTYDGPVPAPIVRGQRIGKLVISAPGVETIERPVVAAADVPQLGFFNRMLVSVGHYVFGGR